MKQTALAVTQFLWVGVLCGASAQPQPPPGGYPNRS